MKRLMLIVMLMALGAQAMAECEYPDDRAADWFVRNNAHKKPANSWYIAILIIASVFQE